MTVTPWVGGWYKGLSTDTKPNHAGLAGWNFLETDTGNLYYHNGSSWTSINTGNSPTGTISIRRTGTGAQGLEFGPNDATGGNVFIDLHTDSGDGDYRTRLIRNSGADGTFDIYQTGRGGVRILQDTIALDSTWAEVLKVRSIIQSTPATAPDWATMKVDTLYRADDVTDPFDLTAQGFKSVLEYGEPGTAAIGTAHARTTNVIVHQSSNSSSEIAMDMAWMRADNASTGSFWFTDWNMHGPVATQPGLLSGVTMLTNNYYNGAVSRGGGKSYAFAAVTMQDVGAAIAGTAHDNAPTYKLTYAFGCHGFAADAGQTNKRRGWEYGLFIGGNGGSWMDTGASKIGTGIQINDVEDFGINIKDPAIDTASGTVTGIAFTNATRAYNVGIDLSTGTYTGEIALKIGANHKIAMGANRIHQGQWRNAATGNMGIEFGPDDATGGDIYMDLHFSNTDGDYAARIIRYTGTNSDFAFINTGTGHIKFSAAGTEFTGYQEFEKITIPADPATEEARLYLKTKDASNNRLYVKVKVAGSMTEKEIAFV